VAFLARGEAEQLTISVGEVVVAVDVAAQEFADGGFVSLAGVVLVAENVFKIKSNGINA
jgi:hypothetical protein